MRSICGCCASEVNNTATPSIDDITKGLYQVRKSGQSCISSTKSLHFCAIVAVVEVEVGQQHVPKADFRQFQECEAQNHGSLAKIHI